VILIMEVVRESEAKRAQLRRLGDRLGAIYTPVALTVAILAWVAWATSGVSIRFLAVLVIATPCPLLIAIPISIIGSSYGRDGSRLQPTRRASAEPPGANPL
jgi:cation transport ATPase